MEIIGQLAGGVAHDFNNLLTVINGSTEILQMDFPPEAAGRHLVDEIAKAGERAATLTRQLLAISRKQILQPLVIDLNALIVGMEKMFRRVIREDVILVLNLASGLWPVKVDPGQLEQVLLNLAVNARDAMPSGGTLSIQTENVLAEAQPGSAEASGDWVRLSVSDTGRGMTEEVKARIFEPFFTTKEPGQGTGLGLWTVKNIMEQSGGCMRVQTAPDQGTTFRIDLPRTLERVSRKDSRL